MNEQNNLPPVADQNKSAGKKGRSKAIIIAVIVMVVGVAAYFGVRALIPNSDFLDNGQLKSSEVQTSNRDTQELDGQRADFLQRFQGETADIADLTVGGQIVAIGVSNSDGSLTADIIRLGDFSNDNFEGFIGDRKSNDEAGDSEDNVIQPDRVSGDFVRGSNSSEFQNMSPEERQARFEELRVSGNVPDGFGTRGGRTSASPVGGGEMVSGEIIDIDSFIITIKLPDGGSRLVIYSDETQIFKLSSPTTTIE